MSATMEEATVGLLSPTQPPDYGQIDKEVSGIVDGFSQPNSLGITRTTWIKRMLNVALYFLAALGVFSFLFGFRYGMWSLFTVQDVYRPQTLVPGLTMCDCGRNTVEALAKGCKFDILAAAWLPPHCRDDDLTQEFERSGSGVRKQWTYYADKNGTTVVDASQLAQLGNGEHSFFTTWEWHVAHCLFYWEKYVRMRDTEAVLEKRFEGVRHPRHCRQIIMNSNSTAKAQLTEIWVHMNARDFT